MKKYFELDRVDWVFVAFWTAALVDNLIQTHWLLAVLYAVILVTMGRLGLEQRRSVAFDGLVDALIKEAHAHFGFIAELKRAVSLRDARIRTLLEERS